MAPDLSSRTGRGTRSAVAFVLAGLTVVLLTAGFFHARYINLEEEEHLPENDALARGVAASILALLAYAPSR